MQSKSDNINNEILSISSESESSITKSSGSLETSTVTSSCIQGEILRSNEKKIKCKDHFDDSFDLFLPKKLKSSIDSCSKHDSRSSDLMKCSLNPFSFQNTSGNYLKSTSSNQNFLPCLTKTDNLDSHIKSRPKRTNVSHQDIFASSTMSNEEVFEQDMKKAIALSLQTSTETPENHVINEDNKLKKLELKLTGKRSKPLLLRRTKEERENIITEKVAIILMESDRDKNNYIETFSNKLNLPKSAKLRDCYCEESLLWRKSSLSPSKLKREDFAIPSMLPFISLSLKTRLENEVLSESRVSESL